LSTRSPQSASSRQVHIRRIRNGGDAAVKDLVAVEEPLEIRLGFGGNGSRDEKSVSITMRTPGNDDELAVGFLFSEGILASANNILEVWHRSPPVPGDADLRNVIRVDLADGAEVDFDRLQRHFYTTSSCGVCGKTSLDALSAQSVYSEAITKSQFSIATSDILMLAGQLEDRQKTFSETGGLHATGLFDSSGKVVLVREDVGRHNAMDKLIGRRFFDRLLPVETHGILVSGRASFELVQKVAMAGSPMLAAVGAPSSLAIDVAKEFDMTLIGFLRDGRFNVYCGDARINP
jgi:FdhD protein